MKTVSVAAILCWIPATLASSQEGWGTLTGKFCIRKENTENDTPIENVLVYLKSGQDDKIIVHPSYEKDKRSTVNMKLANGDFCTRMQLMRDTQTLIFRSLDAGQWSPQEVMPESSSPRYNTLGKKHSFKRRPVPYRIYVPENAKAQGQLFVHDNPYMAKTNACGNFCIQNMPYGRHEFVFWHEAFGYLKDLKIGNAKTSKRGSLVLEISSPCKDLGANSILQKSKLNKSNITNDK